MIHLLVSTITVFFAWILYSLVQSKLTSLPKITFLSLWVWTIFWQLVFILAGVL